jgi:hypothetical protein
VPPLAHLLQTSLSRSLTCLTMLRVYLLCCRYTYRYVGSRWQWRARRRCCGSVQDRVDSTRALDWEVDWEVVDFSGSPGAPRGCTG